jgi:simple sugar transport system permease protein
MLGQKKIKNPDVAVRFLILLVVFAIFAFLQPRVRSAANIASIMNNMVFNGILALGMMITLVVGVLDLAITSYGIMGAYGVTVFCMKYYMNVNMWMMFIPAALIGAACAVCTGYVIDKFNLPGILVSVAAANIFSMMLFLNGYGSGNVPATLVPPDIARLIQTNILTVTSGRLTIKLNITVVWVFVLAAFVWFFLNKTMTGRNIFAIGGNYEAAKRMGINIRRDFLIAFALSGALSAIAMMQSYMKQISITPLAMDGGHGDAMAAVIFGGTQLGNGKGGSVAGTLIGVMVITLIRTNLVMLGIPSYAQTFVIGIMLLASVVMAAYKNFGSKV